MTGLWFSPGTTVSSTNKTDLHDITEILLKVALNTINLNQTYIVAYMFEIFAQICLPQYKDHVGIWLIFLIWF